MWVVLCLYLFKIVIKVGRCQDLYTFSRQNPWNISLAIKPSLYYLCSSLTHSLNHSSHIWHAHAHNWELLRKAATFSPMLQSLQLWNYETANFWSKVADSANFNQKFRLCNFDLTESATLVWHTLQPWSGRVSNGPKVVAFLKNAQVAM